MKVSDVNLTGFVLYDASTGEQLAGYGDHGPCRFIYADGDECRREPKHRLHQPNAVGRHTYEPELIPRRE